MVKRIIGKIFREDKSGEHRDLLPKSLFNFALKSGSMVLGFVITLILTRTLGKEDFGHFRYAFTWTSMLTLLAMGGLGRLSLREFARYQAEGKWDLIRASFRWKDRRIVLYALIVTGLGFAASFYPFEIFKDETTLMSYRIGLLVIPISTLISHRRTSLNGLKEPVLSQFPERIFQPVLFLIGIGIAFFLPYDLLNASSAIGLSLIGSVGALIGAHILYKQRVPKGEVGSFEVSEKKRWIKSAYPILLFNLSMLAFANIDILMLRPLTDASQVGIYAVPLRLSLYVGFLMIAFNAVLAPHISAYHKSGDRSGVQKVIAKTSGALTAIGLLIAIAMVLGRNWFLPWFGDGFVEGGNALIILVIGQVVNVLCGPVGNILVMTNREWGASLTFLAGTFLNLGLNAWLIPLYGFEGAAIATAASLSFVNIIMLCIVVFKLKINPTAFHFKS